MIPKLKSMSQEQTKFIDDLAVALKSPGARGLYFPLGREQRRRANLRLGRDVGYGLRGLSEKELRDILPTLYSRLLVVNSIDSTGVALDNKDFLAAIRQGM